MRKNNNIPKQAYITPPKPAEKKVGDSEFFKKWTSVEEVYDLLAGYSGAMAEDLKSEEDLDSAISDMVQDNLIKYDVFVNCYRLTESGALMANANKKSFEEDLESTSIEIFEQQEPELTAEFKRIQKEQYKTFCQKMMSYGLYNISVGTNLENEKEKLLALTGVWFRSNDKIQRLKQLLVLKEKSYLENEPVIDAWKDLSVYSIIAQILMNDKWINRK